MADGQVTRGSEIVKPNVKKVRKLAGGAGPIADGREGGERGSQSGRRRLALHLLTTPPPLS
jgi:hypothetical protein